MGPRTCSRPSTSDTGEVLTDCRKSYTGADVLRFFKLIDLHVPRNLAVHVVLDNLSAHKAPEVPKWLADPRRARWNLHFIPTSSSCLNLVERWFKERPTAGCDEALAEVKSATQH